MPIARIAQKEQQGRVISATWSFASTPPTVQHIMNKHQHRILWPTVALVVVVALTNIGTGTSLYPALWIAWVVVFGVVIATAIALRKAATS